MAIILQVYERLTHRGDWRVVLSSERIGRLRSDMEYGRLGTGTFLQTGTIPPLVAERLLWRIHNLSDPAPWQHLATARPDLIAYSKLRIAR